MNWLKYFHAIYASALLVFFIYQGATGVSLLGEIEGEGPSPEEIRGHRRTGPIIALLLPTVFAVGLVSLLAGGRYPLDHRYHLMNGALLLATTISAFITARRIGPDGNRRTRSLHMTLGFFSIVLFLVQGIIGAAILLNLRQI